MVLEALRGLEQEEIMKEQKIILDPDRARDAVLDGLASIERGDSIELRGDDELKEFFDRRRIPRKEAPRRQEGETLGGAFGHAC
jgi:hypothetical protein